MPARKGKSSRKRKPRKGKRSSARGSFVQRALVTLSLVVLVLCAASITNGFFIRGGVGREGRALRVKVLNGTGVSGLAHRAKRGLHRRGVDVIEVGNADHFDYEESILMARRQGAEVRKLADMLGCRHVVVQLQEGTLEDATLILGEDHRRLRLGWEDETDLLE